MQVVDVYIEEQFSPYLDEQWLRQVAQHTLAAEGVGSEVEVSLAITDDSTVRGLNRAYRGVDDSTDVLAFLLQDKAEGAEPFVLPEDAALPLGEVIISYPQAQRQAQGHLERELALLVVHRVLHLLGYDDEEPEDKARMRKAEARVLASLSESGVLG